MGYFNYFVKCVIRKFVNFIFNKNNFFKFCCILFLVLVITKLFLQTPISYGATTNIEDTTYYDGYLANIDLFNSLQNDLVNRLTYISNNSIHSDIMDFLNSSEYYVLMYYGDGLSQSANINSLPVDKTLLNLVFISRNSVDRTVIAGNWNNNGVISCSSFRLTSNATTYIFTGNNVERATWGPGATFIFPSYLVDYKCDTLTTYILDFFSGEIGDIGELGGIIQETSNTIIESNQQVQNSVEEQTNTIKQQQEFLTSNTINDDSFVLPEDNTNDTTGVDDEVNFIFDDIMSAFTDTSSDNSITLTFPFTNQTFDISYASVYNGVFEKNNSMAYLKRIIHLGYWYIVAVFVVKDISNKVNKVKTGDIDKIQTGNIKEDLL